MLVIGGLVAVAVGVFSFVLRERSALRFGFRGSRRRLQLAQAVVGSGMIAFGVTLLLGRLSG